MKEKSKAGDESQLLDSEHPWPGLRPFTEENTSYFFGREQEIDDIVRKIKQETLTLVFGKSGLGKTSLLRAGVSPQLRKLGFIPIYIRLNHFEDSLNLEDQVEVFMEEVLDAGSIDAPRPIREETLWEHFHKRDGDWWDEENRLLKPVLIFDQFEEILTSGQENPVRAARSAAFLAELEDLIENRPPAHLLERFKSEKGLAKAYDFERIDYRVVIAIREDYLADLEGLRERLRTITKNRYRLLPLNDEQAMNIIMKPGGHLVEEAVANDIIQFVSTPATIPLSENLYDHSMPRQVESALLSIILSELNNHRIQARKEKISSELVVNRRPESILLEFYEDSLRGLDPKARLFIENQLLTASGGRNRVAETDAMDRHGLTEELIDTLISRRIIQREKTARRTWLELTHDSLTPVVQRCAEANRRKRRIRRIWGYAAVVLVIVMALGATWVRNIEQDKRKRAQTVAELVQDVAWDLRGIYSISMKSQNRIFDRLNKELIDFPEDIKDTKEFKACNARFLLTWAVIQFENGYFGKASEKLKKARKLLFEGRAWEAQDIFSKLTVISFELLQVEIEKVNGNSKLSWQALHRAENLLSLVPPLDDNQAMELSQLQHRMNRIRIDLLADEGKWDEVAVQSQKAREAILKELPKADDNGNFVDDDGKQVIQSDYIHWRRLSSELLRIHFRKVSLSRILNLPLKTDTYFEFEKDIKGTKLFFSDDDTLGHWSFFNALKFRAAALKHQLDEKTIEARSAIDITIANLADLVRDNEGNLQYRYDLGMALLHRAELSAKQDHRQAAIDIKTARELAYTIRKDSFHPCLPFTLSTEADYRELLAGNDKSGNQIESLNRFLARIESYRWDFGDSDVITRRAIGPCFAGIKILIKKGHIDRALELSNLVLQSIERQKDNWDEAFLSNRRFWINQAIITAMNADKIENERWEQYYKSALAEAKFLLQLYPDNGTWAYHETYTLGLRADRYRRKGNRSEAIRAYEKMAATCHDYAIRYPDQKRISVNSIYARYQLIKLYQADGNWQKVANTADLLLEHVDPDSNRKIQYPANELKYWQWALKHLKAAHQEMLKKSKFGFKDTTSEPPDKTIAFQKMLDRSDKALTAFSSRKKYLQDLIAKQQAEGTAKSDKKAEQIDLRVLDLPEVKKDTVEDRLIASQPLSWRVPSMYPSASSYALTGEDFDTTAALIPEKDLQGKTIHRIRSASLSFYDNAQLLTVEFDKKGKPDVTKLYLRSGHQIYELNGTSPPIHRANKKFPIRLETKAHVAAYLRFFCTFLNGDEGLFFPVMSGKDLSWSNDATQEIKQKIESLIRPMCIWTEPDQPDAWYATATLNYSNAIFHIKFRIIKSGMVEMIKDLPIAEDLPINILKLASDRKTSNYLSRINLDLISGIDISDTKKEIKKLKDLAQTISDREEADGGMSIQTDRLRSIVNEMMALEQPDLPEKMTLKGIKSSRRVYTSALKLIGKASSRIDFMENLQIKSYLRKSRETIEKQQGEENPAKIKALSNACLGLSFFQVKIRDFKGALETADIGIKLDPGYLPIYTNHAHALLFLGRTSEAMEIYQQNRGKPIGDKTWDYYILDDFSQFEKLGLIIPEMDQVRKILKK